MASTSSATLPKPGDDATTKAAGGAGKKPSSVRSSAARPSSARASSPKSRRTRASSPIPLSARPKWDDTPLRPRPPALRGLSNFGSEPWAKDEIVYNMKFRMWSDFTGHFDVEERSPYAPTRMTETEQRQLRYMDRWNQKYMDASGTLDHFDGNPFT